MAQIAFWHKITYFVSLLKKEICQRFLNIWEFYFFYSNEHEPINVHAKKGEYESKVEFYLTNALVTDIKITNIKGAKPLKGSELKNFKIFLEHYADNIVKKWIDYFVYHKNIEFERINKKIK